ncbi:hypothetical protein GCM10027047_37550 [Rhodococcus aerolatus]
MSGGRDRLRRAVGWLVRDRTTGHVVIGQRPNAAILVVVAATVLRWLVVDTGLWTAPGTALRVVAALALAWWGVDELVRGVNPLRRGLGVVVLAYLALVRVPALLG